MPIAISAVIITPSVSTNKQALNIAKKVDDRAVEGVAYDNHGNDYYSLSDYQQALEYYK